MVRISQNPRTLRKNRVFHPLEGPSNDSEFFGCFILQQKLVKGKRVVFVREGLLLLKGKFHTLWGWSAKVSKHQRKVRGTDLVVANIDDSGGFVVFWGEFLASKNQHFLGRDLKEVKDF